MKLNWDDLSKPIIALSPMADMTDSAFCRVVKIVSGKKDYPIMFREMVSSEAVVRKNNKTLDMTEIHEDERPLVQQLFGSNSDVMAEAAEIIENEHHPEGFDINMGCPVYKLTSNFNGCALMNDPKTAVDIVKKMKAKISVPLSVKMRAGWRNPKQVLDFAPLIEQAGADLITVHGRTKEQGYTGKSDWDLIAQVKKRVNIPVLANGDIFTHSDIKRALEITECDGVLIARGALGNPWIFTDNENPTLEERIDVVLKHYDLHEKQYGEKAPMTFRKHLTWYFKGLPHMKKYRDQLHKIDSREKLVEILYEIEEFSA